MYQKKKIIELFTFWKSSIGKKDKNEKSNKFGLNKRLSKSLVKITFNLFFF